jgi:hypothetical protein
VRCRPFTWTKSADEILPHRRPRDRRSGYSDLYFMFWSGLRDLPSLAILLVNSAPAQRLASFCPSAGWSSCGRGPVPGRGSGGCGTQPPIERGCVPQPPFRAGAAWRIRGLCRKCRTRHPAATRRQLVTRIARRHIPGHPGQPPGTKHSPLARKPGIPGTPARDERAASRRGPGTTPQHGRHATRKQQIRRSRLTYQRDHIAGNYPQ